MLHTYKGLFQSSRNKWQFVCFCDGSDFISVLNFKSPDFLQFKRKLRCYKNKSTLIVHCEKYPDQMIRCRSSLRRRYVHRGIFAFDVVKYWLVNEKRKCTSATSFEKRRLKNNWPNQHLVFLGQKRKKKKWWKIIRFKMSSN